MFKKYFWNMLIAIDQFFNTLFLGDPDETISSRLGKWLSEPKTSWKFWVAEVICFFLRKIDKNHCRVSIEKDEGDRDLL